MDGEVRISDYMGAAADGKLFTGGAMVAGSNVLTINEPLFTSADVGKTAAVQGAGPARIATGMNDGLASVITDVDDAHKARLQDNATHTVTGVKGHFGTDNTDAVNAALDDLRPTCGGRLIIDLVGLMCWKSADAGYLNNVEITATVCQLGWVDHPGGIMGGTAILPLHPTAPLIDLMETSASYVHNIQLGSPDTDFACGAGILYAAEDGAGHHTDRFLIDRVIAAGAFQAAPVYAVCGVSDHVIRQCQLWQFNKRGRAGLIFGAKHIDVGLVESLSRTIATDEGQCNNLVLEATQVAHWPAADEFGCGMLLVGARGVNMFGGFISAAAGKQATIVCMDTPAGTRNTYCNFNSVQFLNHSNILPKFVIQNLGHVEDLGMNCNLYQYATAMRGGNPLTSVYGADATRFTW